MRRARIMRGLVGGSGRLFFDLKAFHAFQRRDDLGVHGLNVMSDGRFFGQFVEKGFQFAILFGHDFEFDRAIGEILHRATHIKRACNVLGGVAKSYSLNFTSKNDSFRYHTARTPMHCEDGDVESFFVPIARDDSSRTFPTATDSGAKSHKL